MSLVNGEELCRPWMPIEDFRAFQATRPDEEGWELIDGVPVMMTPTYLTHARIAGNIERLLCDALDPSRTALQNIGVDLGLSGNALPGLGRGAGYAPQPDVGVVGAAFEADRRFASPLYVAVEVVSSADDAWLPSAGMRWIDAKARIYQAHPPCEAVVVVEQHRMEVRLWRRSGAVWDGTVLNRPGDAFRLPTCGLDCAVADLYRGTPLSRGPARP